ncbi:MAG: TonB-dependent receptor, partial [Sphingobacteriales bacterium]
MRTGTFELNSRFSTKFSNQLLGTITKINTDKSRPGAAFPFVDILGSPAGAKNNYISFGNEPFNGNNNKVVNDVYTITDNVTYYSGKHTITAGGSYEYQRVGNMFMAGSQGYYVYGNTAEFYANAAPRLFSLTYSLVPGEDAVYSANLKIGQLGLYAQDEINVNPNFKLTAGLRVDRPIYLEQPLENPAITALTLRDIDGKNENYTTGAWPKATWLLSPRVGFRWDVNADKRLIIRGGTGVFTGRIPFVFLTNIPSNSGMYQYGTLLTNTADLANIRLNADPHAYNPFYNTTLSPALFPTKAGTAVPSGAYALTANDFKFPQVWRTNLAVEKQMGSGWNLNLEAIYTKDINAVYMFNANQGNPDTLVTLGQTTRPRYSSTAARKINAASGNAIVLDNTSKGSSFSLTAQLSKNFNRHFYGSVAYTFTYASDVTANPGSQANSVWSVNPTSNTQNTVELAYSNFAVPHRVIATLSYRAEYLKHLGTTVSLFYEGAHAGNYSYIYNGDINNDGNSADLMYIPRDASEIKFRDGVVINGVTYSAKQQSD